MSTDVVAVECCTVSSVSVSVTLIRYCLMIPFCSSIGGGFQMRKRAVASVAVPLRFCGGSSGSVHSQGYENKIRDSDTT